VAYSGVDRIAAVALVARMPLTESEQSVDAVNVGYARVKLVSLRPLPP
jgi:hypothetical protein